MKKFILLTAFLLNVSLCFSQVSNGSYMGNLVDEYVWSRTANDYKLLESIPMRTQIVFSDDYIYFKKGSQAKWLRNKWDFDQKIQSNEH